MTALNLEYADLRSKIVAKASLREGFDNEGGVYVFDRKETISFRDDTSLICRFRLRNTGNPNFFANFRDNELEMIEWDEVIESTPCSLRQGVFEVRVSLRLGNFSSEGRKRPTFVLKRDIAPTYPPLTLHNIRKDRVSTYPGLSMQPRFWLDFSLTLRGDSRKAFPTDFADFKNKCVVSGGRPESKRSKF